jgi:hypothetical protein
MPIANVPCTEEALGVLDERRIPYMPDYVVNGGGVCGVVMADATPENPDSVQGLIHLFRDMNLRLLRTSLSSGVSPRDLADTVAHRNYSDLVQRAYDSESIRTRIRRKMHSLSILPRFVIQNEWRLRKAKTINHLNSLFR